MDLIRCRNYLAGPTANSVLVSGKVGVRRRDRQTDEIEVEKCVVIPIVIPYFSYSKLHVFILKPVHSL
jgi:hypothetical protein